VRWVFLAAATTFNERILHKPRFGFGLAHPRLVRVEIAAMRGSKEQALRYQVFLGQSMARDTCYRGRVVCVCCDYNAFNVGDLFIVAQYTEGNFDRPVIHNSSLRYLTAGFLSIHGWSLLTVPLEAGSVGAAS
jgi:hypothetical protein